LSQILACQSRIVELLQTILYTSLSEGNLNMFVFYIEYQNSSSRLEPSDDRNPIYLRGLRFTHNSSRISQHYVCYVQTRHCSTKLIRGHSYRFSLKILDHNVSWGHFIEAAISMTRDEGAIPWSTVQFPTSGGWKEHRTDKPGVGLMNWSGSKTEIVTTGDIVDIAVDLRPLGTNCAIISRRNYPMERCTCPLEREGDLTIGVSLWSQGILEFTDPVEE
jgi:hypothetical protein